MEKVTFNNNGQWDLRKSNDDYSHTQSDYVISEVLEVLDARR